MSIGHSDADAKERARRIAEETERFLRDREITQVERGVTGFLNSVEQHRARKGGDPKAASREGVRVRQAKAFGGLVKLPRSKRWPPE